MAGRRTKDKFEEDRNYVLKNLSEFRFKDHKNAEGMHSFLSPSKYHWINYDDEKLIQTYRNALAADKGTALHELASRNIKYGIWLDPERNGTIGSFVNDALGFRMESERTLYYSPNAFGTADAISFFDGFLRIHDLKTGTSPASMHQLEIYAALFFLEYEREYGVRPESVDMELRIYQNDEITIANPDAEIIRPIMEKIVEFDRLISKIQSEE